ncbi:hypothetical protein [Rhodosalinus sp. FB01]|uniref:hypothetical protein n=1 Tax=Rhodosalinus sp. FB01 TaxID=3239194 RepID=UPI003523544B
MIDQVWIDWLASSFGSAAVLGFIAYLFRDALLARISSSVNFKFAKQLEEAKAEIRANERRIEADLNAKEREIEKIQDFVAPLKRERSAAVAAKRMEAAELALRRCNEVARLLMAPEAMKSLKIEEVIARRDDPNLKRFFDTLITSMKVDDILEDLKKEDRVLGTLYLSDAARAHIEAYENIVFQAVTFMKLMSIGMDPSKLMKQDRVPKMVIELVPPSAEGFRDHGYGYEYYWTQYFYDKALSHLRKIANGDDQDQEDLSAARELAVSTQAAQIEVRKKLEEIGVSEDLIVPQQEGKEPSTG